MQWIQRLILALSMALLGGSLGSIPHLDAHEHTQETVPTHVFDNLGGDFALTGFSGEKVSLKQFSGKVVILNFGYTSCPDICPLTLANLKQAMSQLGEQAKQVQVLWVTVDPTRDTPARMKEYLGNFHPHFLGLTGTPKEISEVARNYQTLRQKQPLTEDPPPKKTPQAPAASSEPGYLVAHTDFIYVLNRSGKVEMMYGSDVPIPTLVAKIQQVLRNR